MQLGVDATIEQRQVAGATGVFQLLTNGPDMLGLEWRLGIDDSARVPWARL